MSGWTQDHNITIIVQGEPGAGKTSVLCALQEDLEARGAQVLLGTEEKNESVQLLHSLLTPDITGYRITLIEDRRRKVR